MTCIKCNNEFKMLQKIDGKTRNLGNRKFCLDCSPFGEHNTSKTPKNNSIITENSLKEAIKVSKTIADICNYFELSHAGGTYRTIRSKALEYNLTLPKFDSKTFSGERSERFKRIPSEIVFTNTKSTSSSRLYVRLIEENLRQDICSECGQLPVWNNKPLRLTVDHINGNNKDNRLENLRILCYHCHSQTDTWCGKNRKNKKAVIFCDCGVKIFSGSKNCKSCTPKKSKIEWPPVSELLEKLEKRNFTKLGKELGVSGNALKKHLRNKNK